ncbi:MAG: YggT family protein [Clostridiales bacterium]|nr:YggT family protein [Clostridiales bacterium]
MATRTDERVQVVRRRRNTSAGRVISRFVYAVMSVIIVVLAFRFALLLFAANPAATFVEFIYNISAPLMAPFEAVFPATPFGEAAIVEWNSLLAIAVYAVVAWGASWLFVWIASSSTTEVVEEVRAEDSTPPS